MFPRKLNYRSADFITLSDGRLTLQYQTTSSRAKHTQHMPILTA